MTEKDWSLDETINQIKHLLLEKDAEIERLREENNRQRYDIMLLNSRLQTEHEIIRIAALKEGE